MGRGAEENLQIRAIHSRNGHSDLFSTNKIICTLHLLIEGQAYSLQRTTCIGSRPTLGQRTGTFVAPNRCSGVYMYTQYIRGHIHTPYMYLEVL